MPFLRKLSVITEAIREESVERSFESETNLCILPPMARKSFSKFPVNEPIDEDVHSIEFNNSVRPACKPDSKFF